MKPRLALVIVLALATAPVLAPPSRAGSREPTAGGAATGGSAEQPNDLGLFLGLTTVDGDTDFSVGLDYERRLSPPFGIGGVIEYTAGDYRDGIVAVSADWHPWKELKLLAAPGVEIDRADGSDAFLVRIGGEYGFDIGSDFELAPSLNFDFTSDDTAVVCGVSLARKF